MVWGGGGGPKCRVDDPYEWGANAIFTIEDGEMVFKEYYKMPAAQTEFENCVAHNGSLIPVPDRDIMVQSWYQGGISIFDLFSIFGLIFTFINFVILFVKERTDRFVFDPMLYMKSFLLDFIIYLPS